MYLCVSYPSQYTSIISLYNITLSFFVTGNHCENCKAQIKIFEYYLDKISCFKERRYKSILRCIIPVVLGQ